MSTTEFIKEYFGLYIKLIYLEIKMFFLELRLHINNCILYVLKSLIK